MRIRKGLGGRSPSAPPPPSAGPFGSASPMAGMGSPEPGANHDLPAGVMALPYEHPLRGLQEQIHRTLPKGHPLAAMQKMLQPELPKGHPLRQMKMKLLGRMK